MTEKQYRAKLAKLKQFDRIVIKWRDSFRFDSGWQGADDYLKVLDEAMQALEETVGFYVGTNAAYVMVALSINRYEGPNHTPSVTQTMAIPHEAVRSIVKV